MNSHGCSRKSVPGRNRLIPVAIFFKLILVVLVLISGIIAQAGSLVPETSVLWTYRFPGSDNLGGSTPAIAPDGTLYAGTFDGDFVAVTQQGGLKWKFEVNCEIRSSPAVADDGTIYFGSRNRKFYALTPGGSLKWSFATGSWNDSSPAIARDGTIYFGSWDKFFYALNPDGLLKWKLAVGAIVDSSPAVAADGTIYIGAHDNNFYALTPDGKIRWKFATGGEIISSPAIGAGGSIYFSSTDGNLYALKPDGTEAWRHRTGGMTTSSPVLDDDGNIYLGVNKNVIQTFSPGGKFRWDWNAPVLVDVTVAVAAGRVYTTMPWFMLYALKPDKTIIWQVKTQSDLAASPVVGADGTIYVVCEQCLSAIRPPDGALPSAKSSWPMFLGNARHTGRVGP